MLAAAFLLANLALAFYNVGTIWAHEVDIFRSWRLLDATTFRRVQDVHWRKLPYWVFTPLVLALVGTTTLLWFRPAATPLWTVVGATSAFVVSGVLTATLWGPWQARLSKDDRGAESPFLRRILATHWLRTLLINAYAFFLFVGVLQAMEQ